MAWPQEPLKPLWERIEAMSRKHTFQVIVEQDEAGFFVAECPALKACYTQGKTYDEVLENIKDVIALCLADLRANGKRVPRQAEIIAVKQVEVSV
jgi:predicted RNase H-like HicB family nuclease